MAHQLRTGWTGVDLMVSRRKLVGIICIVLIVVMVASAGVVVQLANTPRESDIQVINEEGTTGVAFVVYHPGITSFHADVTSAFVDGLVTSGWRVEMTTASPKAPTNFSGYDLVVVGGPGYGDEPASPLRNYVERIEDFGGLPVVVIITCAGNGATAVQILEDLVEDANGTVVLSLLLFTLSPNAEQYGSTDPLEIAASAGENLTIP